MSDTFNHEADAWESLEHSAEYDWDHEDAGGPVHRPRCKFCGSYAVAWVHTGVRWRLYSEDMKKPHACQTTQVTADDFDDVTEGQK